MILERKRKMKSNGLSEKEKQLEDMAVEYTRLLKQISIAYNHGADASKLLQKKKDMQKEIDSLRKEVGYKSTVDFER